METDPLQTGRALRALRTSQAWPLRRLAAASGCSASFISQIEQGKTSPSLVSMKRICRSLGLTVAEFLQMNEGRTEAKVVRVGSPSTIVTKWPRAVLRYLLPPSDQSSFSILVLELPVRGSTPWRAAQRSMNETGIILQGQVGFQVGGENVDLAPSDAVHFDLVHRHRWRNRGSAPAHVLLLNANFTEVIDEP
ncbi:MAG: helix-turn-helix domain-containing protein [Pirellulales bacterium]